MSSLLDTLDSRKFPKHIAIIMDGNGRWAKERHHIRVLGHKTGIHSVREITTECSRLHLKQLTLYAFSVENWQRPQKEVDYLMKLLKEFLIKERPLLLENAIKLTAIGRLEQLPPPVQEALYETQELTQNHKGLNLCLALSYGGRTEIIDAIQKLFHERLQKNSLKEAISEEELSRFMYLPQMLEPDLLIRTGGEMRLSNFLLWHISYTELYVTSCYWPDFRKEALHLAIKDFVLRERRFGKVEHDKESL
jgi:undecaprenyl diphosphate synthase